MAIPIQVTRRQFSTSPLQSPVDVLGDQFGGMVVSSLFGRYYNLCHAGMVFEASQSTTIPQNSGAAASFCFWNPEESGVLMVPIRWSMAYATGTGVAGAFSWRGIPNAGGRIGTGSYIQTFTKEDLDGIGAETGVARNQFFGGPSGGSTAGESGSVYGAGQHSKVRVGSAATFTFNGLSVRGMAISQQAPVVTGTNIIGPLMEDFDGTLIVAPGAIIWPAENGAASGDTWLQTLIWAEIPI